MIKHYTEKALLDKAREIIAGGEYPCKHRGDGRAGYWDCNELVGVASAKLKNILHVDASAEGNIVSYNKASLCRTFQPLKFLDAVVDGIIAVDFDARSNPGKENSVRNHGTKFRIKIKDHPKIYQNIETL